MSDSPSVIRLNFEVFCFVFQCIISINVSIDDFLENLFLSIINPNH
jgi:hypothetical protein